METINSSIAVSVNENGQLMHKSDDCEVLMCVMCSLSRVWGMKVILHWYFVKRITKNGMWYFYNCLNH